MQTTIEPLELGDLATLSDISKRTFYEAFHLQNTKEDMELFLEKSFDADTLQQELNQKDNYFYFIKLNDQIAGYLKLTTANLHPAIPQEKSLEIARIYILNEKIGLGLGKVLMKFVIELAQQWNKKKIWLGVWEHNLKAIRFYQKFGFQKFDEHEFMVGRDIQTDWLMVKDL